MTRTTVGVLVVDDSVVVRRLVSAALSEDPAITVVGTAASGREALARIEELAPDVVTLDVEMPDMDGLETLRRLRVLHPSLPVIMFSSLTERAAAATLDALLLGARDYVTKPGGTRTAGAPALAPTGLRPGTGDVVRDALIPKIKALAARGRPVPSRPSTPLPATAGRAALEPASHSGAARPRPTPRLLALGASTGGPDALARILGELPADLPVPVLVTQHMPPMFTRMFAERLDRICALTVVEAVPGMVLEPGLVLVAPGDRHLVVRADEGVLRAGLSSDPPRNWCRPSVDTLFESVADAVGGRALACVLTGMGHDGLLGCRRLRAAGAQVVVQDEQTSVIWGMPRSVAEAGLADRVLPLSAIAGALADALLPAHLARTAHGGRL